MLADLRTRRVSASEWEGSVVGRLVTCAFDVEDGQEYVSYLDRVLDECVALARQGRLPDTEEVSRFLDVERACLVQLRRDVGLAAARGDAQVVSEIPMDEQEHARMLAMNDTVANLLQILEYRQALELNRSDAVARVSKAILGGTYTRS
jgi:hypothetical protein